MYSLPRYVRYWAISAVILVGGSPEKAVAVERELTASTLQQALLFQASFDREPHADYARGDRRMYRAADRRNRQTAVSVEALEGAVRIAPASGRFGGALEYVRPTEAQYFFRGPHNLGYQSKNWGGTLSFWLKLNPDRDLVPGYSDPVQLVGGLWPEGSVFTEFSRHHTPRHFRFVMMPVTREWNPLGRKYEEMPEAERPFVAVHQPPFSRERWVHVVCTFQNINSGQADGAGVLYLDGRQAGEIAGWRQIFEWKPEETALTLGVNFVGLIDDLSLFERPLHPSEIEFLHQLPGGIADLKPPMLSAP